MCAYERGRVSVELQSRRFIGVTSFDRDDGGPHRIALDVDPSAFFEEFFSPF